MATRIAGALQQGLVAVLAQSLARLNAIEGVSSSFVASRDGLLVAGGDQGAGMDVKAALAAAVFGALDRAGSGLELAPVRAALVETASCSLQILGVSELLLVVRAAKGANMALIRSGMACAAAELTNAQRRQ